MPWTTASSTLGKLMLTTVPAQKSRFERTLNSHAGCAKRPFSKAAASDEANRTLCRTLSL
jgi:hypothetical protein